MRGGETRQTGLKVFSTTLVIGSIFRNTCFCVVVGVCTCVNDCGHDCLICVQRLHALSCRTTLTFHPGGLKVKLS